MASFDSCAVSTQSTGKLPMPEIRDVARQYERRGMKPEAALLRSLEDQMEMAQMAERQIVQAVRGAYTAKGGKPRPAESANSGTSAEGVRYSVSGDVTDSPAFKKWFGESAVVDEDGKPLRMYHGTTSDFSEFDAEGLGAHFTSDSRLASDFASWKPEGGNVMPVYLSIKNPLRIEDHGGNHSDARSVAESLVEQGVLPNGYVDDDFYGRLLQDEAFGNPEKYEANNAKELTRIRKLIEAKGYDGLVYDNTAEGGGDAWVPFNPSQVKSATGNSGEFSPDNPDIRYSTAADADLVITHNLTEANLLHAVKMGGIAVPSLAVTKKDSALEGFGEITLIGSRAMADPKGYAGTKVFGADIYSPRYPSVEHDIDRKALGAFTRKFTPMAERMGSTLPGTSEVERDGIEKIGRSLPVKAQFLQENGIEPEIVAQVPRLSDGRVERLKQFGLGDYMTATSTYTLTNDPEFIKRAVAEQVDAYRAAGDERFIKRAERLEGNEELQYNVAKDLAYSIVDYAKSQKRPQTDSYATERALEKQIEDAGLSEAFREYVEAEMAAMSKSERIFKGITNSGKRSYIPHTLENVVKILKKELRGGENFNYGAGSLRAHFTPQFKSVADIRKNKDRLVSKEEFEQVKKEIDAEFDAVKESMSEEGLRTNTDTAVAVLEDAARIGLESAARKYGIVLTEDAKQKSRAFLEKLYHLPTEYFEAKILRDVDLAEFSGAVIPKKTSQRVREMLKMRGVPFTEYESEPERRAAVERYAQELHDAKGDILFSLGTMPQARAPLATISPLIQKLADGGAVVVHADASTLPGGRAPAGVQALTERDGTIHLVASSLSDANARAVLLHEAFHAGAQQLIGTAQWDKLMARLASLQKLAQGGKGTARDFYDAAAQRVASAKARGAVASGMETEEFGAYAIEEYESAPASIRKWVDDMIGLVKAWALARFGAQLGDVTPAQLSGLARLALLDIAAERQQRAQPAYSDRREGDRGTPDRRKTVEFQGQRRPIENSRGQLIADDMNKQLAFYRFFKDSKVVDEQQRPLVVYHGTGGDFSEFDESIEGAHLKLPGLFFAPDPADASNFAENSAKVAQMKAGKPFAPEGANVMPVYLAMQNPFVEDLSKSAQGGFYPASAIKEMIEYAKSKGHDGVILKGWKDGSGDVQYIVFRPEQVKSAVGNNGQFDPSNADIRYSVAGPTPRPAAAWTAPESTKIDQIVHTLQDKFVDMKKVVQAIKATTNAITDKFDPYLQEELFHGRSATGFKSYLNGELRPLLVDMQARNVKLAEFETFLHMRHAEETNEQIARINPEMPDGGSGVMTQDARDYLANLPPAKAAAYGALAARVDAMVKGTQQLLLDYGLETQATIDAWNATYQHYVPLNREDMDNMLQGAGTGQGFSIRGSAAKRRTGSDKGVVNVLANLAQAREKAIVRGEKNRLDLALYGLALKAPNPSFWKPVNPKKNPAALMAELQAMGLPTALIQNYMDEPTQKTIVARAGGTPAGQQTLPGAASASGEEVVRRVNTMLRSAPNVIAVRVAGEDRFIFFNERDERALRMAQSLKNLTGGELNRFLEFVGKGTRWFASVNTQYNPIFGVVNLLRDAQGVALNLTSTPLNGQQGAVEKELARMLWRAGGKWFRLDSLTGQDAALWQEFQREGGITGYRAMFVSGDERHAELEKELKRMTGGKLITAGRAVRDWLSDYNEALENATRMAVYKVAKDQGLTPARAASLAKNATTNFNRKGNINSQVGALYAFFNAAIQGTTRIAQTLDPRTTHGKAIIGGGLLLGTMQAVLLAAAGFEDDEPPEFIKAKNLVIPYPFSEEKDYVTIPMPLGFNVIPTISRIATEFMLSGGKKPAKRITDLAGAVLDSFNPIGHAGFSLQTILPTVVDPMAALEANRDYTGKKIYNEDINTTSPTPGHTRARAGASIPAKFAAESINAVLGGNEYVPGVWSPTPEHIEYLTGQLTGGVGREVLKGFQTGQALVTGEELSAHRIPLAGRFYGTTEDGSNVRARFMDNLVQLNLLEQEYTGRKEDKAGAAEFKKANPLVTLADEAQSVQREVSSLNKEKRRLLDANAPRDKVKLMDQKIRTRMEKFNLKMLERREKLEAAGQ